MKRTLTAMTLIASLAASSAYAQTMEEGLSMLELAISSVFNQLGIQDVDVMSLSVSQLALIQAIVSSEDDDSRKKARILSVVNR